VPKGITRKLFIPDPGFIFVNADLSQAEARVVAYLAGEERLIKVFESGGDIHRKNAANVFRHAEQDVTERERELAKRLVHASNYGMGSVTFAKQCGVEVKEAKQHLNAYFAQYPRIKLWQMGVASFLRKSRTMTTPLGRKRTFFNRYDASLMKEALAYVPQSTVADLLNMGLRRLYEKYKDTPTQILLQIHDAVLLQTPKDGWELVALAVKEALTIPIRIGNREVVIPVDITVGENWNDLHKVATK
jgi:DNA polymerase-1